jgi:hypothetical protein
MKHGMATERIATAYFINVSHQSVCLYMYPLSLLGKLGKNGTEVTNTHATVEGFLGAFSKVDD